jgi:hypothetical protein
MVIGKNIFMKKLSAITVFLILSLSAGCSKDSNPGLPFFEVDPQLVGEWFFIDTSSVILPGPEFSFSGFQITADKQIYSLGIETSTGKVRISDIAEFFSLINAKDGQLIVERFAPPGIITDTFSYNIENDRLFLSRPHQDFIFEKTTLGSQLFSRFFHIFR